MSLKPCKNSKDKDTLTYSFFHEMPFLYQKKSDVLIVKDSDGWENSVQTDHVKSTHLSLAPVQFSYFVQSLLFVQQNMKLEREIV